MRKNRIGLLRMNWSLLGNPIFNVCLKFKGEQSEKKIPYIVGTLYC
jgi:hypothetical protein